MARLLLASCLAFAGVYVLAGAGWALLAGAFLTFALWPDGADTALARGWRQAAGLSRALAGRVSAMPRRAGAAGSMASGIVLVPAGLVMSAGLGTGVVAAGALLIGFSLLTGQGA
jgi:hypothetical protein